MKPAHIGSISHGTLRTEDLLSTFASELESLILVNGDHFSLPENRQDRDWMNSLVGRAQDCFSADDDEAIEDEKLEEAEYMVNEEFFNAFQQFAPPYCYFGAHEGDGSDFGFWPSLDSIEELPHVNDSEEAKALGEDCKYVNDHGNVTVYGADGSILLELV